MALAERRTWGDWNLSLHPRALLVFQSVGEERLFELWPAAHDQVLLEDEGTSDEVAEDEDQPLGKAARVCDDQGLGTARWVPNHPVQLMELHLYIHCIGMIAYICSQDHLGWVVPVQLRILFEPKCCWLVQTSLTQPCAWHHRLHPAKVVGQHLQSSWFEEEDFKFEKVTPVRRADRKNPDSLVLSCLSITFHFGG